MFESFYQHTLIRQWNQLTLEYGIMYQYLDNLNNVTWQNYQKQDDAQLKLKIESESVPTKLNEFKNHDLYAIEKWLNKYQYIYPNDDKFVIATVKGFKVYPRSSVHMLYSKDRLYQMGYKLRDNEKVLKKIEKNKNKQEIMELYGTWQCDEIQKPKCTIDDNGNILIPKNDNGNIDVLYTDIHIPIDCAHIKKMERLIYTVKKMNIDYAKALVGFDYHGRRMVPTFDGIIVHKKYEDEVIRMCKQYNEQFEKKKEKEKAKQMNKLWKILVNGIMVHKELSLGQFKKKCDKKKKMDVDQLENVQDL